MGGRVETIQPRALLIGVLGLVTKGLVQGFEDLEITGRVETVQTKALLRSARIVRRVLETWEVSRTPEKSSRGRPSAYAGVKNSQRCWITIIFFSLRVFHISVSWWSSTGVWVKSSKVSRTLLSILRGFHSSNPLWVFGLRFDERSGLGSSLNGVSPEQNFENQFRTWRSVMVPWL